LTLVRERAELMGAANGGAMAAIIGPTPRHIEERLRRAGLEDLDIANYNTHCQTVIAGPMDAIAAAGSIFEAEGARYVRLNVSAAFHSRYMDNARVAFAKFLRGYQLRAPQTPVLANLTARCYPSDVDDIRDVLAAQVAWPVRWYEIASMFLACPEVVIEEVGPGNAMTRLLAQIREQPLLVERPAWASDVDAPNSRVALPSSHIALQSRAQDPARLVFPRGGRVFMYTGQGSQYFRMGEQLYGEHPIFRAAVDECFDLARPRVSRPLAEVVFDAARPFEPCDHPLESTTALFAIGFRSPPPITCFTSSPEQNAGSAPVITRHRAVVSRTARSSSA
jgi:acyl transferase domain-containing protein